MKSTHTRVKRVKNTHVRNERKTQKNKQTNTCETVKKQTHV